MDHRERESIFCCCTDETKNLHGAKTDIFLHIITKQQLFMAIFERFCYKSNINMQYFLQMKYEIIVLIE